MIGFSIDTEIQSDIPTLHLKGELDLHSSEKLNLKLNELLENNETIISINMQKVEYIDSTGLGTIAKVARKLEDQEGHLSLISCPPRIKKLIEISGLTKKNIQLVEA